MSTETHPYHEHSLLYIPGTYQLESMHNSLIGTTTMELDSLGLGIKGH